MSEKLSAIGLKSGVIGKDQSSILKFSKKSTSPEPLSSFLFLKICRSRSQSVELRQDFILEAKRHYERTMHNRVAYPVHAQATSGGTMVSVMSMGGRRPSTDVVFPRREYYSKPPPAVNLVSINIRK
jgi:hypothetical protein